ncbi:MAG: hypothetical protein M5U15_11945 [Kiritimatiellae bacterium]|nr:hypothetical protein [Kiritimatiellia bacterium]
MFFNSLPEHPTEKPSRYPILYSAVIFPGIGQFQQKRPTVGTIYALITLFAAILFVAMLASHGMTALKDAWNAAVGQTDPGDALAELKPVFQAFAFLIAVYVANVYDAWYAWYRINLAWKNDHTPPPLTPSE